MKEMIKRTAVVSIITSLIFAVLGIVMIANLRQFDRERFNVAVDQTLPRCISGPFIFFIQKNHLSSYCL